MLVFERAPHIDDGAFAGPLVDDFGNAQAADELSFRRHRAMQAQALLAMDALAPIRAGVEIAQPVIRIGEGRRDRRQNFWIFSADESELALVHRVMTEAE